jgi:hypothetical protein
VLWSGFSKFQLGFGKTKVVFAEFRLESARVCFGFPKSKPGHAAIWFESAAYLLAFIKPNLAFVKPKARFAKSKKPNVGKTNRFGAAYEGYKTELC